MTILALTLALTLTFTLTLTLILTIPLTLTVTFSRTIIITDTIIGVACSCSTDSGNGGCCDGDRNSRRCTLSVLADVLTGNGDSPPPFAADRVICK